jgi:hypothetical protein
MKPNSLLLLALLAALLVTGCVFPGDDSGLSPPPCNCPNFETAVDSINWAPGTEPQNASSASTERLFAVRPFRGDEADPDWLLNRIRQGAIDSGFDLIRDEGNRIELTAGRLALNVIAAERRDLPKGITVTVEFDGEDSPEVAELLEPLRLALEG